MSVLVFWILFLGLWGIVPLMIIKGKKDGTPNLKTSPEVKIKKKGCKAPLRRKAKLSSPPRRLERGACRRQGYRQGLGTCETRRMVKPLPDLQRLL